jgi:hypothetical protein
MKRTVALSLFLACSGVLLGDSPKPAPSSRKPATLLEDLVRLTQAGSSDVAVLAYAKAHRLELPPEVSDRDLGWLRDSGVSETVVRYMTAIDIRASDEDVPLDVASGAYGGAAHSRAAYSYPESDDEVDRGNYPGRYAVSYPESDYDAYAGYGYNDYPFYGYGYYPYPVYFFVGRDGLTHRFHGRDPRFARHRGLDGGRGFRGHRGNVAGRGGSRDAWRERGFSGRRGGSSVAGPSGRPAFARGGFGGGFQGPRGRVAGPRGFGPSGAGGHGGFSHPGSSGGPHTGGGLGHSSRVATGAPGGRGRR